MKKYKNYLIIGGAVILLGLLIYFLIPHFKFWTLQGLSYKQKDNFHILSENQTYSENYKMYWAFVWTKEYDDWLIDRMVLDKVKVEENREGFTDGRNRFLNDHNLLYYFNKLQENGDRTIYEKTEEALMRGS